MFQPMRGTDTQQSSMFSYLSPEERVPADHPLRPIRLMVDDALKALSPTIADAQRKRWAASKEKTPAKAAKKPKRKFSAEGRAAIVTALKKRWAAKKAAAN